jgi:hypothetical protein
MSKCIERTHEKPHAMQTNLGAVGGRKLKLAAAQALLANAWLVKRVRVT